MWPRSVVPFTKSEWRQEVHGAPLPLVEDTRWGAVCVAPSLTRAPRTGAVSLPIGRDSIVAAGTRFAPADAADYSRSMSYQELRSQASGKECLAGREYAPMDSGVDEIFGGSLSPAAATGTQGGGILDALFLRERSPVCSLRHRLPFLKRTAAIGRSPPRRES